MKRIFALLLPTLLLTACLLGGCRAAEPAPAEPAPAEDPAPAEEPAQIEPASSVGPAEPIPVTWTIEHMDLSEGLPVDMYFEIPVFSGDSEALERINADLASVRQSYVEDFAPDVRETVRYAMEAGEVVPDGMHFTDTHDAAVRTCSDELISVTIDYGWWMGGVTDYGTTTYTYDAVTGERLCLPDLLDGTDEEIKESIVAALLEQYPGVEEAGVMDTPMDVIRGMDVRDIRFYVEEGVVHVAFAKYEIAYGAAGAFDVILPGEIKPLA